MKTRNTGFRGGPLAIVFITLAIVSDATAAEETWVEDLGLDVHGFLDVRGGRRVQSDPYERDASLMEGRLQLDVGRMGDWATFQLRADLLYDDIAQDHDIDIEEGIGWLDLREANVLFTPLDFMDVKVGRQILTWGTGDLLFVNDLFPKDWQSFFAGRDVEYLKAPSDALFASVFSDFVNLDVAYMPRFDADRYISGERFSYWNPLLGRRVGTDAVAVVERPDAWFRDDEVAARASRNVAGYDVAVYAYVGYWKSPVGLDLTTTNATFPELAVYGASIQGSLGQGVVSAEAGYYDSGDDHDGNLPTVPNSEVRLLVGYERELARNITGGVQYYVELMQDHGAYLATLPEGFAARDEDRHVVTLRLTRLALNQDLTLSLFAYYSPSDKDGYLRPSAAYKVNDQWTLSAGGSVFVGSDPHTFFGQFEENTNIYGGVRYSF
jgi:hypothetical protein